MSSFAIKDIYDLNSVGATWNPMKMSNILQLIFTGHRKNISRTKPRYISMCKKLLQLHLKIKAIVFHAVSVSWSYYISNSKKTWSRNRDGCEIATPTIQYRHKDLTVDINGNLQNKKSGSDTINKLPFWIHRYIQIILFEITNIDVQCIILNNIRYEIILFYQFRSGKWGLLKILVYRF
jgi:hypothetical protein